MKKSINPIQRDRYYGFEAFLFLLFVATIIAMANFERFTSHTYTITAGDHHETSLSDDRLNNGGDSVAQWVNQDQGLWTCDLGPMFQYYYCLAVYDLHDNVDRTKGVNLNVFDEVTIHFDYRSDFDDTLRIHLRNFNPEYSVDEDDLSRKFNEYEFRPSEHGSSINIKMEQFYVANWWLLERHIPARLSDPNFDNITHVQIQTGSKDKVGLKTIQIKKMVFTGQRIPADTYYLGIIIVWMLSLSVLGAIRILQILKTLRLERKHRERLSAENEELNRMKGELETQVYTDKLTGVTNRGGFEKALEIAHRNWKNHGNTYGLLIIDLDYFKNINDEYGHQIGDEVLSQLGTLLKSTSRQHDTIGRWGGEEFAMLAEVETLGQLKALGEKVRSAIEESIWPSDLRVTASIGLAIVRNQDTAETIFERADTKLYKVKRSGRNGVMG